jgi:hypothetical protein
LTGSVMSTMFDDTLLPPLIYYTRPEPGTLVRTYMQPGFLLHEMKEPTLLTYFPGARRVDEYGIVVCHCSNKPNCFGDVDFCVVLTSAGIFCYIMEAVKQRVKQHDDVV